MVESHSSFIGWPTFLSPFGIYVLDRYGKNSKILVAPKEYDFSNPQKNKFKVYLQRKKYRSRWIQPLFCNSFLLLQATAMQLSYCKNKEKFISFDNTLWYSATLSLTAGYIEAWFEKKPHKFVDYFYSILFYAQVAYFAYDVFDGPIDGNGLLKSREKIGYPPVPPSKPAARRIMPFQLSISF